MRASLAAAVLFASVAVAATPQQAPPATENYLARIVEGAKPIVGWQNISNDPDYDNQPSFLPDS